MCPVPKAIYRACWLTMCISCFYLVSVPLFLLAETYNLHGKVNGMCVNNLDTFLHWYGSYKHILSDKTFDSFIIIVLPSQRETPLYKHIILCRPSRGRLHHIKTLYLIKHLIVLLLLCRPHRGRHHYINTLYLIYLSGQICYLMCTGPFFGDFYCKI